MNDTAAAAAAADDSTVTSPLTSTVLSLLSCSQEHVIKTEERAQKEFRERLATFSPVTFFAKPPSLSPIVCARFGWKNTAPNLLVCSACRSAVALAYPSSRLFSGTASRKLTCVFEQQVLGDGHAAFCSYRQQGERYRKELLLIQQEQQQEDSPTNALLPGPDYPATATYIAPLPPRILPMLLASIVPPQPRMILESVHPQSLFVSEWKRWYERLSIRQADDANNVVGCPAVASIIVPKELLEFQLTNHSSSTAAATKKTTGAIISTRDHHGCTKHVSFALSTTSSPALVQISKWCLSSISSVTATTANQEEENETASKRNVSDSTNDNHGENVADHPKDPLPVAQIAAALVLLGWFVPKPAITTANTETKELAIEEEAVPCECPLCLGQFDWNHALQPTFAVDASPGPLQPDREDGDGTPQPPAKRARRTSSPGSLTTVASFSSRTTMMTAHKYYCPYLVGFPIQGASSATPLWQSLSRRVLGSTTSPASALRKRVLSKATHATSSSAATATTTTLVEPVCAPTPWDLHSDLARNEQTVDNEDTDKDDSEYDSTAASFLQMHQILRSSLSPRFRRLSANGRPTLSPPRPPTKQPETV